ncbi:YbfB/YjiJ family MFS transporter [Piscirickettsia salmonis]|uniref:YbfB/YjiJ family MFS transporter n=1 Tax=Piscirickettsia salmonis TaxID=1238 RepID=UPI0007C92D18|nr:Purine efflux pump PbuE [Piscirickettsiaceae bacterium NZ-RLO1]
MVSLMLIFAIWSVTLIMTVNKYNSIAYACIAGFCLFVIAMGINRFSYGPVIPFLINEHWVTNSQAGYIGSLNFFGYFIGAYISHKLICFIQSNKIILYMLVFSVVASILCVFNFGYMWLGLCRFILGIVSGIIMVLTPTIILHRIAHDKKGMVSGIMFAGIGLGIAGTSILIPIFNHLDGVHSIWINLALLTVILALMSSIKCIKAPTPAPVQRIKERKLQSNFKINKRVYVVFSCAILGYACYGFGLTPSLLFLPVYAHKALGVSLEWSSILFALLGVGCIIGSLTGGWMHHNFGNYPAVLVTTSLGIISLILIIFTHSLIFLSISAFLAGFYLVALVVLMSLFIDYLVGMENHAKYWSYMTLAYAISQFLAGYVFSYVLSLHVTYTNIFWVGLIVLLISLLCYSVLPRKCSILNNELTR